jgi:hypothetical protein
VLGLAYAQTDGFESWIGRNGLKKLLEALKRVGL